MTTNEQQQQDMSESSTEICKKYIYNVWRSFCMLTVTNMAAV